MLQKEKVLKETMIKKCDFLVLTEKFSNIKRDHEKITICYTDGKKVKTRIRRLGKDFTNRELLSLTRHNACDLSYSGLRKELENKVDFFIYNTK